MSVQMKFLNHLLNSTVIWIMVIQGISVWLPEVDPSNLKVSKFSLIFSLFLLLLFSLSIFCSDNIYFWINMKICGLENSFLSRWFSLVYSKVAVLSNLGWKSIEVTGLILIFAVILKLYKLPVKMSTIIFIISWDSLMFYQIFLSPQVKQCAIITYCYL